MLFKFEFDCEEKEDGFKVNIPVDVIILARPDSECAPDYDDACMYIVHDWNCDA